MFQDKIEFSADDTGRQKYKTQVFIFDSIEEHMQHIREIGVPRSQQQHRYGSSWQFTLGKEFVGRAFNNIDEALEAQREIWNEGLWLLTGMKQKVKDYVIKTPRSTRRKSKWSYEEGEIDINRLNSSQPAFRTTHREKRSGPASVTIVVNCGARGHVHNEDIMWRGAGGIVLTEMLEQAGYRVELWGARFGEDVYEGNVEFPYNAYAINLKRGEEMLDSSSLINSISGWGYRTAGFLTNFMSEDNVNDHYGGSMELPSFFLEWLTSDYQIFVCDKIWSESEAVSWIQRTIESLD